MASSTRSLLFDLLLVLLVTALAAPAAAEPVVEAYRVQHRTAEGLLPVAAAAMAGEGSATADRATNSVLLIGEARAVRTALALLKAQDRARVSVVLRYESVRLEDLDSAEIRVDWSAGSGSVRVGNVAFPGGRTGVRVSGFAVRTHSEGGLTGLLRVVDGEEGQVVTGRTVPVHSRGRYYGNTAFVTAESGFRARPRVLGDGRIQVELAPLEGSVDDRGRVGFLDAATTVTVNPGQTVAIGGISRASEARQHGTRTIVASQRSATERVLLLTATVE